eukprot:1162060-Pelagomonas_calceolata.AAC.10
MVVLINLLGSCGVSLGVANLKCERQGMETCLADTFSDQGHVRSVTGPAGSASTFSRHAVFRQPTPITISHTHNTHTHTHSCTRPPPKDSGLGWPESRASPTFCSESSAHTRVRGQSQAGQ